MALVPAKKKGEDACCLQILHSCSSNHSWASDLFQVSRKDHRYLQEIEMREEGGTPSIVGAVRCGLVFQLKAAIDHDYLRLREEQLCRCVQDDQTTNFQWQVEWRVSTCTKCSWMPEFYGLLAEDRESHGKLSLKEQLEAVALRSGVGVKGPPWLKLSERNGPRHAVCKVCNWWVVRATNWTLKGHLGSRNSGSAAGRVRAFAVHI